MLDSKLLYLKTEVTKNASTLF